MQETGTDNWFITGCYSARVHGYIKHLVARFIQFITMPMIVYNHADVDNHADVYNHADNLFTTMPMNFYIYADNLFITMPIYL